MMQILGNLIAGANVTERSGKKASTQFVLKESTQLTQFNILAESKNNLNLDYSIVLKGPIETLNLGKVTSSSKKFCRKYKDGRFFKEGSYTLDFIPSSSIERRNDEIIFVVEIY